MGGGKFLLKNCSFFSKFCHSGAVHGESRMVKYVVDNPHFRVRVLSSFLQTILTR